MLRVGVGLSNAPDSARAAAEAAAAAVASGGLERVGGLLVFATTHHGPGFSLVARTAGAVCGTSEIAGCSAAGVIAGDQEVEQGPAVAVLALGGKPVARRFFVPLSCGSERVADQIAGVLDELSESVRLLVLFADTHALAPAPLLEGLGRRFPGVPVVGGGASDDGSVGEVSVFAGNAVSSRAVAGLALSGELRATVGVTHAVRRVGPVHRVTAARGRLVLTLDRRPAYEAFASVVPAPLLRDARRALAVVVAGLPVGEGEFVVRPLAGIDAASGALAMTEAPVEGQELFFGVRDPAGARADLAHLLDEQAAAWRGIPPTAALYVNCMARGRAFHGVSGLDTAYIRQHFGPLPIAGFFSAAEFASGGGTPRLHQYTGVLAMLGAGA